jgi:TorA maturation chaperone TorD
VSDLDHLRVVARLFARLLLRELDAATLEHLRSPEVEAALGQLGIVLPESDSLTLDALAADYFEHFVNPRDRAPLIQSLHEGGSYEGDAARAVREIASAAGVEFDAEAARAVPPDHLGCELLLWDVLAARDPEAAAEFARRHLVWAVAPLRRNPEGSGFYSSLRAALAALLIELA